MQKQFIVGMGIVGAGLGLIQTVTTIEELRDRVVRLQTEVGICCGTEQLPAPSSVLGEDLEYVVKLRKEVEALRARVEILEKSLR